MLWAADRSSRNQVAHAPFDIGRGASGASNQGAGKAPLGTTAKSVDQVTECGCWEEALKSFSERAAKARKERRARAKKTFSRREGRAKRFKLQRTAARLLEGQG